MYQFTFINDDREKTLCELQKRDERLKEKVKINFDGEVEVFLLSGKKITFERWDIDKEDLSKKNWDGLEYIGNWHHDGNRDIHPEVEEKEKKKGIFLNWYASKTECIDSMLSVQLLDELALLFKNRANLLYFFRKILKMDGVFWLKNEHRAGGGQWGKWACARVLEVFVNYLCWGENSTEVKFRTNRVRRIK